MGVTILDEGRLSEMSLELNRRSLQSHQGTLMALLRSGLLGICIEDALLFWTVISSDDRPISYQQAHRLGLYLKKSLWMNIHDA